MKTVVADFHLANLSFLAAAPIDPRGNTLESEEVHVAIEKY
jgi:hypothetical protein